MTLLILAAGMGSRYGGLKQIEPVTENGEFIIDFSVYDAIASGFDKVVFVIKEENLELFRETVGKRFEGKITVEYAFQKSDDLPKGYKVPEGREKPWGTAHAVLAARGAIDEPFAVINADDFYGRGAYETLAKHLRSAKQSQYCMVGYVLKNTLTENGTVSRGVCQVKDGRLVNVVECTKIKKDGDVAVYCDGNNDEIIPLDATVSMNCWGFTPDVFEKISAGFEKFLDSHGTELRAEYYLPYSIKEIMDAGMCDVSVYPTDEAWYGVTYKEDRETVVNGLSRLKNEGVYPEKLH